MSLSPATFALPATFLGLAAYDRAATFCVAGIPLDVGTTNRSGARDGPAAIRRASRMLVDGAHPVHRIEPATMPVADIGDFSIALGDIGKSLDLIERQAAAVGHLIALGGEHGITLPLLRALSKRTGPLALVHFDAHVDTWPDNFGQRYAHGSVFFHAIEEGLVDPRKTIQIGIRSPMGTDVHDWTLSRGVRIIPAEAVHETGPAAVAEQIRAVVGDGPTYLSVDVDVLDPAFAPGTGTPEIGGLASWQLLAVLRRLGDLDFRGMDVVEVAPAYDVAEITALAAATVAWEYLALMGTKGPLRRVGKAP
ncbi:agmatinase [Rhodoplanes azumiensis]|uniref:Agmatinase n=1 Tax=Rhodoplanes azumiensis TaxID=1897628 RepID=A0ABW5AFZ8_9BRAD